MDIDRWQRMFFMAVNRKYPSKWTTEQRLLAIQRQIADVSHTHQFGELGGISIKGRIAGIFPDLFMLCEQHGMDLNEELKSILDWFNSNAPPTTRG